MTRIRGTTVPIPGLVGGLQQDPAQAPPGTFVSATNLVPLKSGRMAIRGGSRLVNTLHDDAGSPAELTHICRVQAYTQLGMLAVGWSDGRNKHYAYRLTADGAFFTGVEATSRIDLTLAPSTSWSNTTAPARPMMAELWEKMFLVDATSDISIRNTLLSLDSSGTVLRPALAFAGGAAAPLKPFCIEEFNNVLFVAGYGDEVTPDRPEYIRHSFLGRSPDATTAGGEGFDAAAWIELGAIGQAVTAMCKGDTAMLVAKRNELYRISGNGRAYAGWQYEVEHVKQSLGLGAYNPWSLCFAEDFWYGIGENGPFRTDGVVVEPLKGPRESAWALVSNPEAFFVEYHPDRGLILFGVRMATGLPSGLYLSAGVVTPPAATYPNVLWAWDIARQVWTSDLGFNLQFFHVRAVPTTTVNAPQATPTATAATNVAITTYSGNWTNGDASASTQYYEQVGDGPFAYITTLAPTVATLARTGLPSHSFVRYYLQHVKGGAFSTVSNTITVQTLLKPPLLSAIPGTTGDNVQSVDVPSELDILNYEAGMTLRLEESLTGVGGWTETGNFPHSIAGITALYDGESVTRERYYRARVEDTSWSVTLSAYSNIIQLPDPV